MKSKKKPRREKKKPTVAALVKSHKTIRPDLSIQEIRFCQSYAVDENAVQSFKDAKFNPTPSSDGAASVRAFRLLRKVKIREYIQNLRDAACEAATVTTENLARAWKEQAYADRTAIVDKDGNALPPSKWPQELKSIIAGLEITTDALGKTTWKVKFERSTEAKKVLSQWRGMIGGDKEQGTGTAHAPLIVGGEASPDDI